MQSLDNLQEKEHGWKTAKKDHRQDQKQSLGKDGMTRLRCLILEMQSCSSRTQEAVRREVKSSPVNRTLISANFRNLRFSSAFPQLTDSAIIPIKSSGKEAQRSRWTWSRSLSTDVLMISMQIHTSPWQQTTHGCAERTNPCIALRNEQNTQTRTNPRIALGNKQHTQKRTNPRIAICNDEQHTHTERTNPHINKHTQKGQIHTSPYAISKHTQKGQIHASPCAMNNTCRQDKSTHRPAQTTTHAERTNPHIALCNEQHTHKGQIHTSPYAMNNTQTERKNPHIILRNEQHTQKGQIHKSPTRTQWAIQKVQTQTLKPLSLKQELQTDEHKQ